MKNVRNIITCPFILTVILVVIVGCAKKQDDPFIPDPGTVKDADGNVYHTVVIGTQVWMAENLKTTKFNDGTPITNIKEDTAWYNATVAAYCWYNNDTVFRNIYGGLYNFAAVNTGKLAPVGWRVASKEDLDQLIAYLGGFEKAGGKLKSTGTVEDGTGLWIAPNIGATNSSGFTALPNGMRNSSGVFFFKGLYGYFWSSTLNDDSGWAFGLRGDSTAVYSGYGLPKTGIAVRCLLTY